MRGVGVVGCGHDVVAAIIVLGLRANIILPPSECLVLLRIAYV